ncbi:MAG: hypothetical protein ACTSXL_06045 [Alphaproteobacteria bacterium]
MSYQNRLAVEQQKMSELMKQGVSKQRKKASDIIKTDLLKKFTPKQLSEYKNIIGIPVVGFGNQSQILNQTWNCLKRDKDVLNSSLILFLVNKPKSKSFDDTSIMLLKNLEKTKNASVCLSQVDVNGVVQMGDLRSAMFDAYLSCVGDLCPEDALLIITDDDNLEMSPNWTESFQESAKRNKKKSLFTSSVKFDGEDNCKNDNFPMFWLTERLRQNIAKDYSKKFFDTDTGQLIQRNNLIFGGDKAGNIESVILSTMALRPALYKKMGGFPSIDEITKTIRLAETVLPNCIQETFVEITTDNRRQLVAFQRNLIPSVAAWKDSETQFQSNEIDPIRVKKTNKIKPESNMIIGSKLAQMYNTVFDYMGVTDSDLQEWFLLDLGTPLGLFRANGNVSISSGKLADTALLESFNYYKLKPDMNLSEKVWFDYINENGGR